MGSTLGQRLRALRIERGLSQAELAGDLVSPSYVSLIEAGRRSPEREVLEGLARKLGCSPILLESGIAPEEINEQRLRLQFAEIALANGDLDEAHRQFSDLSQQAGAELKYNALWGLARTTRRQGDLHAALSHVDELLAAARAGEPGTPGLLSLLNTRCVIYRASGDLSRSIEVGEAAVREVRDLGLEGTEDEIKLASTLVACYWDRGDLFSAQHLAEQVIARAESLGTHKARSNAYWNASGVAAERGDLALALELANRTLALLSESDQDASLARMRITYGWLLLKLDPPRLAEADAALARAHEVLSGTSFGSYLSACEAEMARSALLRGDAAGAAQLAARAAERCGEDGSRDFYFARFLSGLADIMDGRVDQGALLAADGAGMLGQLGARIEAGQAWRDLAEALIQQGRPDEAIEALRQAADSTGARPSAVRTGQATTIGG
jgi:transcriptional regulator with XRE-family HTH domain